MADDRGRRRSRWFGIAGLSAVRLWTRTVRTRSGRLVATVAAVALTIALLLVVTGIALGLADGGIATQDDADVRVAPEDERTLSAVDGIESPRLGEANERAETIGSQDGVDHASPVLVEQVRLESESGEERTVLLVGVVPDDEPRTVAGLSTAALEASDGSETADDAADGSGSTEIVLSAAAADDLEAGAGEEVSLSSIRTDPSSDEAPPSATITAVEEPEDGADGPVALVHLEDLQSLSGAERGELADRVLVWGETESAETAAADAYPDAAIESTAPRDPSSLFDDGLAFATSVIALIVGVAICASFVATTMGMTVNEDRRSLAVLAAVGFPTHSRLLVVALSTALTTLAGAVLGIGVGVVGIYAINAVAGATVASGAVAAMHPVFVPYALGVALVSGLIATPYPLAVAARTTILAEVER